MEFTVSAVEVDRIGFFMPLLQDYIEPVLEKEGLYSLEDIIKDLIREDAWLFIADNGDELVGAAIVRLESYPQKKYVLLHVLGGDYGKEWAPVLVEKLRALAKQLNMDGVIMYGRKGWTKIFPDAKQESIVLTMPAGD